MKNLRMIATVMILLCAVATARTSGNYVYSALIGIIAILGWPGKIQWKLAPIRRTILVLIITLLYAIGFRYFSNITSISSTELANQMRWEAIGQYFLALMVIQLFLYSKEGIPPVITLLAFVVIICIGHMNFEPEKDWLYQVIVLILLSITLVFSSVSRSFPNLTQCRHISRWLSISVLTLCTIVPLGYAASYLIYTRYKDIDFYLVRAYFSLSQMTARNRRSGGVGFSKASQLTSISSMKGKQSQNVALRVYSENKPGYLRAKVFDTYQDTQWSSSDDYRDLKKLDMPPAPLALSTQDDFFEISPTTSSSFDQMEVWPDPDTEIAVFAPLDIVYFAAPVSTALADRHDIIEADQLRGGMNFITIKTDGARPPISEDTRLQCLQIPDTVTDTMVKTANDIFEGSQTTSEKIRRIEDYFNSNYTYRIGIEIPQDRDPVEYFITEKPPAHCEYFASASTLLLRLAKVPARYVTGFFVDEQNPITGYWIARNKDAHAWVEVWDDQQSKWIIVETTPPGSIGSTLKASTAHYLTDALKYFRQELQVAMYRQGVVGLIAWIFRKVTHLAVLLITTPVGLVIISVAALYAAWRMRLNLIREKDGITDETILKLRQILKQMDKHVSKYGFTREESETLHQFAKRMTSDHLSDSSLQTAANWYLHYAHLRYSGNSHHNDILELQKTFNQFKKKPAR